MQGWQGMVAYVNIGCYYLVGIPMGVLRGHGWLSNLGILVLMPLNSFAIGILLMRN